MTDLPTAFRSLLDEHFTVPRLSLAMRQTSTDGTEKFLFRLDDGEFIETVSIPEGSRLTLCISSQAGCALQCAFCATGRWDTSNSRRSRSPAWCADEALARQHSDQHSIYGKGEPSGNGKVNRR